MHKKSSGFTVFEGLLIIILVAVLGFAGWAVWHAKYGTPKAAETPATTSKSTATNNVASNGDAVVNSCPDAPNTSWCSFFYAKYQLGISYPAGWRATAEPGDLGTTPGTAEYGIDFSPLNNESSYVRINVFKGDPESFASKVRQGLEGKNITATDTSTTVHGNRAVRLDYSADTSFGTNVPVSEYFIASHGYVFDYDAVLRANTPNLTKTDSQKMFDSFTLWQ